MDVKRREELKRVCDGLMRETLHGSPPIKTTMELAIGLSELLEDYGTLKTSAVSGWSTSRALAVAYLAPASERAAVRELAELEKI